jgi:hypothetical protein
VSRALPCVRDMEEIPGWLEVRLRERGKQVRPRDTSK